MKVIALEMGFYGGSRRRQGDVFEFAGEKCGKWFIPVDSKDLGELINSNDPEDGKPEVTRNEIMAQLSAAGIEYKTSMKKDELLDLLKAAVAKASPGSLLDEGNLRESEQ